jgi:hypothetical protein
MLGVAAAALLFDRFSAVPLFLLTAAALPALGLWFAFELGRRAGDGMRSRSPHGA